jgi:hypothetical protein
MRWYEPVSACFFPPFAIGEMGLVIAPLGPLHQAQDVCQCEGLQGQYHL